MSYNIHLYEQKYLKYKNKYLQLKYIFAQNGTGPGIKIPSLQQLVGEQFPDWHNIDDIIEYMKEYDISYDPRFELAINSIIQYKKLFFIDIDQVRFFIDKKINLTIIRFDDNLMNN